MLTGTIQCVQRIHHENPADQFTSMYVEGLL
jgi:hypothetical protein